MFKKQYPSYTFIIAISLFIILASCKTSKVVTVDGTKLYPTGRTIVDTDKALEMITSASHFKIKFEGKSCKIYAKLKDANAHNYLQYELDGVYQKRVRINGNDAIPIEIMAVSEGIHELVIYKATEAQTGPIFIQKIEGKNIKSISPDPMPLIEFIGNSITCGAAADPSENPCGSGSYHDQHNAYMAYGPRVARALGTEFILSSVSGIGIYRTWNRDSPNMPMVFENADFQVDGNRKWDFHSFSPSIVSIALGTNDYSNGDRVTPRAPFDPEFFIARYIDFVVQVKKQYSNAQIALLTSPMVGGERRVILQNCLEKIKLAIDGKFPKDKPVALHFFNEMQARGCSGHPNVEDHAILAEELIPFFKGLMTSK